MTEPLFQSTHSLPFECAAWPLSDEFLAFRIGTCRGLWRCARDAYEILVIVNEQPDNGHLQDVFDWFDHSCRRDSRNINILEILSEHSICHLSDWQARLRTHGSDSNKTD